MKKMLFSTLAVGICLLGTGCASGNFMPQVEPFGEVEDNTRMAKAAQEMPIEQAKNVQVYFGKLPEGLTFVNGSLKVESGYSHRVLGKVWASPATQSWLGHGWYPYIEEESWRRGFCKVNNVLYIGTLSLWAIAFPPFWSCLVVENSNDVDAIARRKKYVVAALKRGAKVMGAYAVVITSLGKIETINAATKVTLGTLEMTGAEGYAVLIGKK